jgi:putative MATE family efflux protein
MLYRNYLKQIHILQVLFHMADIAVLGIFCGDNAVAAVGANTSLTNLVISLFVSFSVGTNVVLARYVGAKDKENARKTVGTSIIIAVIFGLILIAIGVPLAPKFLQLMNCAPAIIDMATTYLRIYFLGMPIMLLYNFSASILRAVGDTKRPLIFLAIGGVINVLLNLFFVLFLNMTVEGVAIATITSQAISAFLSLIVLLKGDGYGVLKLKHLRIYKEQFIKIAYIAIPSGLQSIAFSISNVLIQTTVNSFGEVGMSANATAQQFDGFLYQIGNAIAMSAMAFVSQNFGAKKMDRVKKSIFSGILLIILVSLTLGTVFTVLSPFLCGIIANSQEVIEMASIRLSILSITYFLCSIYEVLSYSLRGMGKPVASLIISILGAVVTRIICLEVTFAIWPYFATIYFSYPVSWAVTILMYSFAVPIYYKKLKQEIESVSS